MTLTRALYLVPLEQHDDVIAPAIKQYDFYSFVALTGFYDRMPWSICAIDAADHLPLRSDPRFCYLPLPDDHQLDRPLADLGSNEVYRIQSFLLDVLPGLAINPDLSIAENYNRIAAAVVNNNDSSLVDRLLDTNGDGVPEFTPNVV